MYTGQDMVCGAPRTILDTLQAIQEDVSFPLSSGDLACISVLVFQLPSAGFPAERGQLWNGINMQEVLYWKTCVSIVAWVLGLCGPLRAASYLRDFQFWVGGMLACFITLGTFQERRHRHMLWPGSFQTLYSRAASWPQLILHVLIPKVLLEYHLRKKIKWTQHFPFQKKKKVIL